MSTARQRSPPCTAAAASREQRDGAPRTRAAAPTAAATSDLLRDDARHHLPDVGSGSVAGGGLEAGFVQDLVVGPVAAAQIPPPRPRGGTLPRGAAAIPWRSVGWAPGPPESGCLPRPRPPSP